MAYGFIVKDWRSKLARYPVEDVYSINNKEDIFVVADGVTRDSCTHLPNTDTLFGKIKFAWDYPRPSPAKMAADIFTKSFFESMKCFNDGEKAILESFDIANTAISDLNKNLGITYVRDYCVNDYAGCVGAGIAKHKDGSISWGYVCDCGVAIFDGGGELRFRTENDGPNKYDSFIWKDKRLQNTDWKNPFARTIVRRDYRNNPNEENSFGVLNGESAAMHYVKTGTNEIKPGEHLIVYSDGLENVIFSDEFSNLVRKKDVKGIRKLCTKNVITEGTLIHEYYEANS